MPQGPYLVVEDGSGHVVKGPTILKFIGGVVSRLTSNTAEITISGSSPQLSAASVAANASLGSLPANAFILYALFRETAGHAVNVAIGSTSGASDVMSAVDVPASGTISATTQAFSIVWFSATLPQTLFLSSASWGGASINCALVYQIGP